MPAPEGVWAGDSGGNGRSMTEFEDTTPQEEERPQPDARHGDTSAHPAEPDHDPIQHPAPPGNPDADEEAIAKGEETLGRVTGR